MRSVKRESLQFPYVHSVSVVQANGVRRKYYYHRLSKERILAEPGDANFEAQYLLAANGHKTGPGRRKLISRKRAMAKAADKTTFVYFILSPSAGMVKIGRAVNVARRLSVLQTGCAEKLQLISFVRDKSGGEMERDFHKRFAEHRQSGEWFTATPELMSLAHSYHRGGLA